MDDIHARVPVDMVAVRVVMFPGEHFEPKKRVTTNDSELPLFVGTITKSMRKNKDFTDLSGVKFGRFVVIGIARDYPGRWVVRCNCGKYTTRRKKAITNPENTQDRCEHCRHLAFLKRNELWRSSGVDKPIGDF